MNGGAWRGTVHEVAKSRTQLGIVSSTADEQLLATAGLLGGSPAQRALPHRTGDTRPTSRPASQPPCWSPPLVGRTKGPRLEPQETTRAQRGRKSPLSWGRVAAELVSSNPTPGLSAACPVDEDTGNLSAGTGGHPSGMNSRRAGSNCRSPACPKSSGEGDELGVA